MRNIIKSISTRLIFFLIFSIALIYGFESRQESVDYSTNKTPSDLQLSERASDSSFAINFKDKSSSGYCLGCHDGMIASDSTVSGPFEFNKNTNPLGNSHPVDINYTRSYQNNRRMLKSPGRIDPRLKMDNGKISCLTCHDENSSGKKHLVMNNRGSRLCLSCHNM